MRYDIAKYERLRSIRIDKDLTQKYVADEISIAPNTLSQYEAGLRNVPNAILAQLALLYGTSVDYLLGLTDQPRPYPRAKTAP